MVIELACTRSPRQVISYINGWIEGGDPSEIRRLYVDHPMIKLSDLDPRLEGTASIRFAHGARRHSLRGSGPIAVEGRELRAGDRVRITTGGEVLWSR